MEYTNSFTPYDINLSFAELKRKFPKADDLLKVTRVLGNDSDLKEAFVNYIVTLEERRWDPKNVLEISNIREQCHMLIDRAMKKS